MSREEGRPIYDHSLLVMLGDDLVDDLVDLQFSAFIVGISQN